MLTPSEGAEVQGLDLLGGEDFVLEQAERACQALLLAIAGQTQNGEQGEAT